MAGVLCVLLVPHKKTSDGEKIIPGPPGPLQMEIPLTVNNHAWFFRSSPNGDTTYGETQTLSSLRQSTWISQVSSWFDLTMRNTTALQNVNGWCPLCPLGPAQKD